MEQPKEYYAFISYKREDEKWAKWLQHKLEHYKLPSNLNGRTDLPKEIRPVFKDNSELSPGNLPLQIHAALEQSKNLIVICSPRSAGSEWVNKEIEAFISMGKTANVIPFIVEGTPYAKNTEEECFPIALRQLPEEQEILGANINEMGRDAAAVKVVARMFDVKFDTLWQRYEREQKKKRLIRASLLTAFVLGVLGVAAWIWHQNVLLKEKDWKMMENQARAVAEKAMQLTNDENNSYLARLLALDVLPTNVNQPDRPYTSEAEAALRGSCQYNSAILRGHTYDVNSASFSPDGKYIVSASSDSAIRIWNTETGQCSHVLKGHNGNVKNASFSPNGQRIVSASWDKDIRIWDSQSGQCLQTLKTHTRTVETASFSPDGKRIVSASSDSTIRIWDATTGECLQTMTGHTGGVFSAFYSPDGKYIVSASGDLSVRIWDAETGKNTKILKGHKLFVRRAFFSPDGKHIASVSFMNTARIWDVETGKCLHLLEEDDGIKEIAFSPDGKYIISASTEGCILIWDVESGQMLGSIGGVVKGINSISFSPDGQYLLLASDDKTIRIWSWDLSKSENVIVMKTPGDGNYSAFYSPDGRKIVSSSFFNESVYIWDAETGQRLQTLKGHTWVVNFASFSPDGKRILSASEDGTVRVWDAETGNFIQEFSWNGSSGIFSALYSPNGKYIVAASQESVTFCLWDAETGTRIPFTTEHGQFASFSPDSKFLVIAPLGHDLLICDVKTGQCVQTMHGHTKSINTVYFSPDGKQVVSASYDNTIRIWDVATGDCIHTLEGHKDAVNSAVFSSDGKLIVSASSDKTIRIWDVETGQCLHIILGHSDEIKTASFCPDGRHIVSASLDGSIRIWDFPPLQELIDQTRERFKDRQLTPEERRKYYLE